MDGGRQGSIESANGVEPAGALDPVARTHSRIRIPNTVPAIQFTIQFNCVRACACVCVRVCACVRARLCACALCMCVRIALESPARLGTSSQNIIQKHLSDGGVLALPPPRCRNRVPPPSLEWAAPLRLLRFSQRGSVDFRKTSCRNTCPMGACLRSPLLVVGTEFHPPL